MISGLEFGRVLGLGFTVVFRVHQHDLGFFGFWVWGLPSSSESISKIVSNLSTCKDFMVATEISDPLRTCHPKIEARESHKRRFFIS